MSITLVILSIVITLLVQRTQCNNNFYKQEDATENSRFLLEEDNCNLNAKQQHNFFVTFVISLRGNPRLLSETEIHAIEGSIRNVYNNLVDCQLPYFREMDTVDLITDLGKFQQQEEQIFFNLEFRVRSFCRGCADGILFYKQEENNCPCRAPSAETFRMAYAQQIQKFILPNIAQFLDATEVLQHCPSDEEFMTSDVIVEFYCPLDIRIEEKILATTFRETYNRINLQNTRRCDPNFREIISVTPYDSNNLKNKDNQHNLRKKNQNAANRKLKSSSSLNTNTIPSTLPSTTNDNNNVPVSPTTDDLTTTTTAVFDTCSVCGTGKKITAPDKIFVLVGQESISCGVLEEAGLRGQIPPVQCDSLPPLLGMCKCAAADDKEDDTAFGKPSSSTTVIHPSNTAISPTICSDIVGPQGISWHDTGGEDFNCDWYALDRCDQYGNSFENYGYTANEACCACGGGSPTTIVSPPDSTVGESPDTPGYFQVRFQITARCWGCTTNTLFDQNPNNDDSTNIETGATNVVINDGRQEDNKACICPIDAVFQATTKEEMIEAYTLEIFARDLPKIYVKDLTEVEEGVR